MHAHRRLVVALHAVHADVLRTPFGIRGENQRQRDERSSVERPRGENRQLRKVDVVLHDLVNRHVLRDGARNRKRRGADRKQLRNLTIEGARDVRACCVANTARDFVERFRPEGQCHAFLGAELVREHRELRTRNVGEEERRASGFHDPIGDLRDLEIRVDACRDFAKLARSPERPDEIAQRIVCHAVSTLRPGNGCRPHCRPAFE